MMMCADFIAPPAAAPHERPAADAEQHEIDHAYGEHESAADVLRLKKKKRGVQHQHTEQDEFSGVHAEFAAIALLDVPIDAQQRAADGPDDEDPEQEPVVVR